MPARTIFRSLNGVLTAVAMRDSVLEAQALIERRNAIEVNWVIARIFVLMVVGYWEEANDQGRGCTRTHPCAR